MNINRQIPILSLLVLIFSLFNVYAIQLSAETVPEAVDFEDYIGVWQTELNNEAIYLLIKKNSVAAYFYKDRIDNSVYKGTWELAEDNTLLVSSLDFDNIRFQFKRDSEKGINNNYATGIPTLIKVNERLLGEWSQPPGYEAPKNKYIPSTYFGIWETQDQKNLQLVKVLDNRTVIKFNKEESISKPQNILQGEWYKHGKQLHIAWEDGTYNIIDNRNENRVRLLNFVSGEAITDDASNYTLITQNHDESRESNLTTNQLAINQQKNISLSQFNYKSLLKFYRGEWVALDEKHPDAIEIMKFSRFGGVDLSSDKKTKGNWYLSGKDCLINLEDGVRMRLKHVGSAFLIFVYKANRPLDAYPNKILKAAPLHPQKLDMLNTELYFTLKLLNHVKQLHPKEKSTIPLISNWSDRDTINPLPSSPWWWPIWSDAPKTKEAGTFSTNNLYRSLTNDADSIASNKELLQKKLPDPMDKPNKSKWTWPF